MRDRHSSLLTFVNQRTVDETTNDYCRTMRTTSFLASTILSSVLLVGACGGDDSGKANSSPVSIEEFCGQIEALDAAGDPEDMASALATLEDLASAAPTKELRDALDTMLPLLQSMSEIDENDPNAFAEVMSMMMDPAIMEAGTVLEDFGAEECGFTE